MKILILRECFDDMQNLEKWKDLYVPPKEMKPLLTEGKIFKSVYDWELSEEDKEKAHVELGETDEKKEKCLCELKAKLSKDKHFHCRTDDFYLLRFLRIKKYDCKKSYGCMKSLHQMRKERPNFFAIPPNFKSLLDRNVFTILPYTDEEGRALLCSDAGMWNPQENSCDEMVQILSVMIDIVTVNPKLQINGAIAIWDLGGLSANHIVQLLIDNRMFPLISLVQSLTAWRMKKIIGVNTGRAARFLYSIVRPLIKRKIVERIILLGSDMSELHQYVDPVLLPKKFSGKLHEEECLATDHIMNNLQFVEYERSFSLK